MPETYALSRRNHTLAVAGVPRPRTADLGPGNATTTLDIRQILCIGKNYADHATEQGAAIPTRPVVFTKNLASLCLSGDAIVIPKVCQDVEQVDFEGEVGVVIAASSRGELARNVPRERAHEFVLGLTVCNDVSARWWQKEAGGGQFFRGKSFDTFCPVGPAVVAVGDVSAPRTLTTRVNGVVMQQASTSLMLFDIPTLIAELSRGCTLLPGTLLLTGTPAGVGFARKPPIFLKHADRIEIDVQGVGSISNTVQREA